MRTYYVEKVKRKPKCFANRRQNKSTAVTKCIRKIINGIHENAIKLLKSHVQCIWYSVDSLETILIILGPIHNVYSKFSALRVVDFEGKFSFLNEVGFRIIGEKVTNNKNKFILIKIAMHGNFERH